VPAIDLLAGTGAVREAIDAGRPLDAVMEIACRGREVYEGAREEALLYG
jgi:hypothetical protein